MEQRPQRRSLPATAPIPLAVQDLIVQANFARRAGSSFVAEVLETAFRYLPLAPITNAIFETWSSDPGEAALAMRLNAALHRLARSGDCPLLTRAYAGEDRLLDRAVAEALLLHDVGIGEVLAHPTQTNEVARSAAFVATLMALRTRFAMPFELFELGASCGLNLNLSRYDYDLGGRIWPAHANSSVKISPEWRGPPPPGGPVEIVSARGCDLHPLDPNSIETRDRLMSFIWPRQPERSDRLAAAMAIARDRPPEVEAADAVDWLKARLAPSQSEGLCRVVFHSMFRQYLRSDQRAALERSICQAGDQASASKPLAWLRYEWSQDRREVQLLLDTWPGRRSEHLANGDAYASWIEWFGAGVPPPLPSINAVGP